jgi:sec-independent protein translocase protein TatB
MDFLGLGIGLPQLLLVLVVAYLLLGPEKLPEVARQIARGVRTLRSYAAEVQGQFEGELGGLGAEFVEIQRDLASIRGDLRSGLTELDTSIRSVHADVVDAVSPQVLSLAEARDARNNGTGGGAGLDYAPAAPEAKSAALPSSTFEPRLEAPADGSAPRLPDFKPPA